MWLILRSGKYILEAHMRNFFCFPNLCETHCYAYSLSDLHVNFLHNSEYEGDEALPTGLLTLILKNLRMVNAFWGRFLYLYFDICD